MRTRAAAREETTWDCWSRVISGKMGIARLSLAAASALGKSPEIQFIEMPVDIRDKYQYHTEAKMERLVAAGYRIPFTPLETAVEDYINHYLIPGQYL